MLAASRLMTAVERGGDEAEAILDDVFPRTGRAYRVGLTGGTGSGKSTLIDALTAAYRRDGRTVGIVAEDPTSPFSGGAVLGDRVRMTELIKDDSVFIRSMASRGSSGGLSLSASEASDILEASGKNIIIFETLGVGQAELEVRSVADTTYGCTWMELTPAWRP